MIKAVFRIAGSAAFGQAVLALSAPLLARLFSPSDIGLFSSIQSLVTIAAVFVTLRFEYAIPVASPEDCSKVVSVGVMATLFFGGLLGCASIVYGVFFAEWFNEYHDFSYFAALLVVFLAINEIQRFYLIRSNNYKALASSTLIRSFSQVFFQVLAGLSAPSLFSLCLAFFVSQACSAYSMYRSVATSTGKGIRRLARSVNADWQSVFRDYKSFPSIMLPLGVVNAFSQYLPVVLAAAIFGPLSAGIFAMSQRLLSLPMVVVGKAVGDVFYGEFARKTRDNEGGRKQLYFGMLSKLVIAGFLEVAVVLMIDRSIYVAIFGEKWSGLKETVDVMAILGAIQLTVSPLAQSLVVLDKKIVLFVWDCFRLISLLLLAYFAQQSSVSYAYFLDAYSGLSFVFYFLLLSYSCFVIRRLDK